MIVMRLMYDICVFSFVFYPFLLAYRPFFSSFTQPAISRSVCLHVPGPVQDFFLWQEGFPMARRFSLPLLLAQGSGFGFYKAPQVKKLKSVKIRIVLLLIILRICQMWPLQLSFFYVLYAKHLGISLSIFIVFSLYLSVTIGCY